MADETVTEATKKAFCKKSYDEETGQCAFVFGNGTTVEFNLSEATGDAAKILPLHGVMQKGGDSYASVKGNYAEGIANLQEVLSNLRQGIWKGERGDSGPRLGELCEAIARIKGVSLETATAAVEKATADQQATWKSNVKVKSVIATLRAEKAAAALEASEKSELEIDLN